MIPIRPFGLASTAIFTSPMKWPSLMNPIIYSMTASTHCSRFLGAGNSRSLHGTASLWAKKNKDNIKFSVVPRDQTKHTCNYLEKFYQKEEPVSKGFQMPLSEIKTPWFEAHIKDAFDVSVKPSTVQAIDKTTGETVGILVGTIIDPEVKPMTPITSFIDPKKSPVNHAMYEFYDVLLDGIDAAHQRVKGKDGKRVRVNDILYMNTHPDYAGLGIGHKLADMNEAIAESVNGGVCFVITTSQFTYQIFMRRGYELGREIKYAEYKDKNGRNPFAPMLEKLKPHVAARALFKKMKPLL